MKHKKHCKEKATEIQNENPKSTENADSTSCCGCAEGSCGESAQEAPQGEVSTEIEALKKQLEEKTKQSEENFNRFARMQADFENYKKRVVKEKEEMHSYALENIVKNILPVVDNMERAIGAFRSDNLDSKYVDGVDMVFKQLIDVLEKNGVKEIEAQDKDFDPNFHHAVMQLEAGAEDENKVKQVLQKGYTLGSKVIRPSLVGVAVK